MVSLNSRFSCFHLLSAGMANMYYHTWFMGFEGIKPCHASWVTSLDEIIFIYDEYHTVNQDTVSCAVIISIFISFKERSIRVSWESVSVPRTQDMKNTSGTFQHYSRREACTAKPPFNSKDFLSALMWSFMPIFFLNRTCHMHKTLRAGCHIGPWEKSATFNGCLCLMNLLVWCACETSYLFLPWVCHHIGTSLILPTLK